MKHMKFGFRFLFILVLLPAGQSLLGYTHLISLDQEATTIQMPTKGICAHRGASETHPENTVAAFNEAVRLGVQMIEFDVQRSKDGHAVVMHDPTLDRTTNAAGAVCDYPLKTLRELDAGGWKDERFRNERLPPLSRVLSVMPDNVWLNVHLKKNDGQDFVIAVAREIALQHRLHQAFLSHPDADILNAARQEIPGLLTGCWHRLDSPIDPQEITAKHDYTFVQLYAVGSNLKPSAELIRSLHDKNIRICYFGEAGPEDLAELDALGVDFVMTDDPARWRDAAAKLGIAPVKPVLLSRPDGVEDHSFRARPSGDFSFRKLAGSFQPAMLMGDCRVKIGPEAQLFIDEFLVHSMKGLTRSLHPAKKYQGNPILLPEKPWEKVPVFGEESCKFLVANGTVLNDPESGLWRMYYKGSMRTSCLAVSKDLLHWERPILNQVEFDGSTENNIVFNDFNCDLMSIVYDPRDTDSSRRWKAAVFHYVSEGREDGLYAWYSPDGISWRVDPHPILPGDYNWAGGFGAWSEAWPQAGVNDVNQILWDEKLQKFTAHLKILTWKNGRFVRSRGFAESEDFVHWSEPRMILIPDENDPEDVQYYGSIGWPYESLWIGLMRVYHEKAGNVNLQLICSRDGRNWKHAGNREPLIPNGPEGSYDQGYMTDVSNPPIPVGDELWFFYSGTTTTGKKKRPEWQGGICLATLPRDRFVSLDAGSEEGWIMTRPFTVEGKNLMLNADASRGEIRVEAVDYDIQRLPRTIPGFERETCKPVNQDSLRQPVEWQSHKDLNSLQGKLIRLKLHLKNARLYSFTIQ